MHDFQNETSCDEGFAVLDSATFSNLKELSEGGDEDLVLEIVTQFFDDLSPLLDRLDMAVSSTCFEEIVEVAHTIKGSASIFGLMKVAYHAENLEKVARARKQETILQSFKQLQEAVPVGQQALLECLNKPH